MNEKGNDTPDPMSLENLTHCPQSSISTVLASLFSTRALVLCTENEKKGQKLLWKALVSLMNGKYKKKYSLSLEYSS